MIMLNNLSMENQKYSCLNWIKQKRNGTIFDAHHQVSKASWSDIATAIADSGIDKKVFSGIIYHVMLLPTHVMYTL